MNPKMAYYQAKENPKPRPFKLILPPKYPEHPELEDKYEDFKQRMKRRGITLK